jgi:diguanylate cyclase (GGDEF)-like protein
VADLGDGCPDIVGRYELERALDSTRGAPTGLIMVDLLSVATDPSLIDRFEEQLVATVRETDAVARVRPGQWALAVPVPETERVADRLRRALAVPLPRSDGRERTLSCTVSVAVGEGDELLWQAAVQSQAESHHRLHTMLARIMGEARTVDELAELVVAGAVHRFRAHGAELVLDGRSWRAGTTEPPAVLEVEVGADGRRGVLRVWAEQSYRQEHGFVSALRTALCAQLHRVGQLERALDEADHDPMTGLLNRRGLLARLESGEAVHVAIIDLDRFKAVNDQHGHDVGDSVLAAVAARISAVVGRDGWVARWGGEEFVVVTATDVDLGERCELVRSAIELARLGPVAVTVSVGMASGLFDVARAEADRRLYDAKAAGRNLVVADR